MLRIKLYQSSEAMENYLNKKANMGYTLETINTFGLFEPLRLDAYYFNKSSNKSRVYRVDSRKLKEADFHEYKQIFIDDGWTFFSENHTNDNFNNDNIFYSDDPTKHEIFSDEESGRKRNRDSAVSSLYKGLFLFMVFIFLSIFLPSVNSGSSNTVLGFILHNLYVIVAIAIIVVSATKYIKDR